MRKIIGIGETVFDIIFKNGQPISGRAGGSVFNALVSLGRMGQNPIFISEVGDDMVGKNIKKCMTDNGVSTEYLCPLYDHQSPLALAFLDENEHPEYMFYKDYPKENRLDYTMPDIQPDDIVIFGSFFALDQNVREQLMEILNMARNQEAIVYYDLNFRKNHAWQVRHLMPEILENMEYATIIKGSDEDFVNIYNETNSQQTYDDHIEFFTKNFIYTEGENGATIYGNNFKKHYDAQKTDLVSTVGAGDSFNAGIIYGLLKNRIRMRDLKDGLDEETWDDIVKYGVMFSSKVCSSIENYIPMDWAKNIK